MRKLILIAAASAAALSLAACSSGDDAPFPGSAPPPTPTPPVVVTPPAPAVDAFFTRVNNVVGAQPDDAEAADVATVALTEPEDSEPVPL